MNNKGAVPKEPPCVERWELVSVAFSHGEALLIRSDMVKDGYFLIQDDLEKEYPLAEAIK